MRQRGFIATALIPGDYFVLVLAVTPTDGNLKFASARLVRFAKNWETKACNGVPAVFETRPHQRQLPGDVD